MSKPEEPQEQEFEILEALARVDNVGDFRLTEFMRQHGMNPGQTAIFYRRLIKEAREDRGYKKFLDDIIDENHKEIAKLNADVSAQDRELKALKAKINKLENETRHKTESLESERQAASESQEDANSHNLLKEFLQGRMHPKTVEGLYRLFYDTHMGQLHAEIGKKPPPDPGRLDKIEERLRDEFRQLLQVPRDTLEDEREQLKKEWQELKKQKDALVEFIKRVYGGEGIE